MRRSELLLESYDYFLPEHLIAKEPLARRDHSRLLVYHKESGEIEHRRFYELPSLLPEQAAILFNDTKVIKARLFGKKSSGGAVELLLNRPLGSERYSVMIKGRVKEGSLLLFDEGVKAEVVALKEDGSRIVTFYKDDKALPQETLYAVLERIGNIPLPPYLKREANEKDSHDYQTLFSKKEGAVAAPTASLHFTGELLDRLKSTHPISYLTLHVGLGTFLPVESATITEHEMHSEIYDIDARSAEIIESQRPLVAVGSTVIRSVEHYAATKEPSGLCDLFLHPHNPPKRVEHLITNFHLPKSTLLMMVAAFIGLEELHRVYACAIENEYRFYSYGDAMMVL